MSFEIMLFAGIVLGGLFFTLQLYLVKSRRFRNERIKLDDEVEKMELHKAKLEKSIAARQDSIDRMSDKLKNLNAEVENVQEEARQEDLQRKKRARQTTEERLLQKKYITPAQLEKAKSYKEKTKSEMDIVQILLMFDYVTPQQIQTMQHD